jgi:RNA polymerase sigma-70 factor (sigma-E family)
MAGGDDGFDEFAVAAWPRLCRSAYLLTGDHHLAEDLTQTALARTFAHWRRVRRHDALAYSRKVLVNANIDRLRRRRMVEVGGGSAEHELDRTADREDAERATSDRDHVVRLLAGLTDKERRVVVLRHYFDLSEADVAGELGIAPGTVKSTLSRALAKLRVSDDSLEEAVKP